ncbi:hypothetical protein ABZ446_44620 [Streptomyces sp. NPDC005813]|uniref:hypothetical protein n=1 Tax=Streptomyces sp. NPDC005813 TaxID=3155592 RepID=UPI0033C23251
MEMKVNGEVGGGRRLGTVGMTPMDHAPDAGLAVVPLLDMPHSPVVVAHAKGEAGPFVRSFVDIVIAAFRQ